MDLTLIIPVFNGAKYIEECLRSILGGELEGVEVIVVNDGSTDDTEQVVRRVAADHINRNKVIYIATPNGGVSHARNIGLKHARGRYIGFIDSDDLVCKDYLQSIRNEIAYGACVIEFGYRTITADGALIEDECFARRSVGRHSANDVSVDVFSGFLWYPFLRVVRRELFDDLRFPGGVKFCEDLMVFSAVYRRAKVVSLLDQVLYEYRINPNGATCKVRPEYSKDLILFYRSIINEKTLENRLLKLNLAYVIRGCLVKSGELLGRLPIDIEIDLMLLIPKMWIFRRVRPRFVIYGFFGPLVNAAKAVLGPMYRT